MFFFTQFYIYHKSLLLIITDINNKKLYLNIKNKFKKKNKQWIPTLQ